MAAPPSEVTTTAARGLFRRDEPDSCVCIMHGGMRNARGAITKYRSQSASFYMPEGQEKVVRHRRLALKKRVIIPIVEDILSADLSLITALTQIALA
jgi:hypothetical protein